VSAVTEPTRRMALPLHWRQKSNGAEYFAEAFGCFILIAFGDGVVAMLWALVGSGRSSAGPLQSSGDWLLINPAITLGQALRRQFPWRKVPGYWAAQVFGCFVGAALVYLVYYAAIHNFEVTNHIVKGKPASVATYSTFATFPAPYFHTVWGPLIDQIVGTGFLCLFVFAVTDEFNLPVRGNLGPVVVGLIVMAVGISFGANAGYAINPARDFGPRIFALFAGYGKVAFPGDYAHISDYFWVPIVGPLIGAGIAAFVYDIFVQDILKARHGAAPGLESMGEVIEETPPAVPNDL
jgi:glycerol uptake facilitator protein